jgi:hypothetical protein
MHRHRFSIRPRCATTGPERARRLARDGATAGLGLLPRRAGESRASVGDSPPTVSGTCRKDSDFVVATSDSLRLVAPAQPSIERIDPRSVAGGRRRWSATDWPPSAWAEPSASGSTNGAARVSALQPPDRRASPSYVTLDGSPTASNRAAPYGICVPSANLEIGGNVWSFV